MLLIEKNSTLNVFLFLFIFSTFFYRVWDVFYKRHGVSGRIYYKWTLPLLSLVHSCIGLLALFEYCFIRKNYNATIGLVSFVIFLFGQIIRNRAIATLGELHSPHIEIKPNHQLIRTNIYSMIRHPYYLGVMLEIVTTPLVLNAYYACLFAIFAYLPAMLVRIKLEEKIFRDYFGESFVDYKKQVSGFAPICITKRSM